MKLLSPVILLLGIAIQLFAQQDESTVYKQYSTQRSFELLSSLESDDYAVGLQVKGKLANVLTNFGEISSFHIAAPSLEWPAFGEGQVDEQQYGWGINLLMGYKGDVIESFQDPASNLIDRDWKPANENLFSGELTVSDDDLTPIMATSDNKLSWPLNGNDPFWPGLFREDTAGVIYDGQFTSERDLYCVYTDAGNQTPYGIRVEQTAYSFARRYAEDFLVYRFNIQNTSNETLENLYPGMFVQFLIDFDNHDLINFIDSNEDGKKDLIYMWDENNDPRVPWIKVGYIGMVVISSPQDKGITDFHYFHDDFIPSSDDMFWRLMTSDTTGLPDTTKQIYFHGDDIHIDDVSFAPGLDPEGNNAGGEITWSFSSGPVSLAPAESMPLEIAIVCGDNEQDLLDNVQWIWFLASNGWNGSNPPSPPKVNAFSGDGQVTISWDAPTAENSTDNITGEKDFEGYKLYRSTDRGKTWGKKITDPRGDFIGFEPIAQFDLKNSIIGNDPISNRYLGNDNGIKHSFVDSSVQNGIEYWYTTTAYDRGDSLNQVESLESALGLTTDEVNVALALPLPSPSNFNEGKINIQNNTLLPDSGISEGLVSIQTIDPTLLQNREYKITFNDNVPVTVGNDTVDFITTFNLIDKNSGDSILVSHPLTDESGDNIPVVDGFRLSLIDTDPGVSAIGWKKVLGDTCTFEWYTHKKTDNFQEVDEAIFGFDDYKIIVVDSSEGTFVTLTDGVFGHVFHSTIKIPIKVFKITDPDNPIDISAFTEVFDFRVNFPNSELLGPLGWDLIPGGAGFNQTGAGEIWPDILALNTGLEESSSYLWLKTQNGPANATPPAVGDEFEIIVSKPFHEGVVYSFSTQAGSYATVEKTDLKKVRVVPNPFFVTTTLDDKVMFTNLPDQCDINIYNVAGDLVKKLDHQDGTGTTFWDLKNENGLDIAFGLYIYVVKTGNGQNHKGKFSVIR